MTARTRALGALLLAAAVGLATSGRASQRLGTSPHGAPDGCPACHEASEGGVGGPRPAVATCRGCHPDAEMHVVGVRPESVRVPDGWPLEDGVVTCATCHAEPGCDAGRPPERPWLRGGTPDRRADFCYRCHASEAYQRTSPHLPADPGPGVQAGCPACHTGRPADGASVADSALRLPPEEACATCHPGPTHVGAAEHVGKTQSAPTALPLAPGGTIGCWSCHDVHAPPGPPPRPGALATTLAGAPRPDGREALLALPAVDGTLCRSCHGAGP